MKAVASKINKRGGVALRTVSLRPTMEPVLAREYQALLKSNGKPMVIVDDDTTISLANAEF